jgi:D-alanyl-D-alanine carboxypeptidase/D-alanyl-D-alanine-endopeptidase (penicillin-binding protein 4)
LEGDDALAAKISALLGNPLLKEAAISIDARVIATGKRVVAVSPDSALNPASVTKIATSAAAFELLGPSYQFETEILSDKAIADGVLDGNLYLRGHGDPRLTSERVYLMVTELRQLGLKKVSGDLVVDDGYFDSEREPRGWEKVRTEGAYHAGTGALSVNFNSVAVKCLPGEAGKPAIVTVEPDIPYIRLSSKAKTVTGGQRKLSVKIRYKGDREEIEVTGSIPAGDDGKTYYRKITNPPAYAGMLVRHMFRMQGMEISGGARPGRTPDTALPFHKFLSERLAVIARDMNKSSNNFTAEQVLKVLGGLKRQPAGFDDGLAAVHDFLERTGLPLGSYTMTNGSGLSHRTRFSASQLVTILGYAWKQFKWAPDFVSSLSIAAGDGTVRKRYKGAPMAGVLRAKTGTIDGVSSIAGYLQNSSGETVAVAIIINGFNPRRFRDIANIEDDIINAIGESR